MGFFQIYLIALGAIITMMIILWIISIPIKNVSIVDLFWGFGFVVACFVYFLKTDGFETRKILLLIMVTIWGLRLSIYLAWRNLGKGEDFRYQKFRKDYGENRYWWISFFQTFLLQGILMWLISAPLLGAQFYFSSDKLEILDFCGVFIWIVGFVFESVGDIQLARFKANPANKGKVLKHRFLALYPSSQLFWRCRSLVWLWFYESCCRKLYPGIRLYFNVCVNHQSFRSSVA